MRRTRSCAVPDDSLVLGDDLPSTALLPGPLAKLNFGPAENKLDERSDIAAILRSVYEKVANIETLNEKLANIETTQNAILKTVDSLALNGLHPTNSGKKPESPMVDCGMCNYTFGSCSPEMSGSMRSQTESDAELELSGRDIGRAVAQELNARTSDRDVLRDTGMEQYLLARRQSAVFMVSDFAKKKKRSPRPSLSPVPGRPSSRPASRSSSPRGRQSPCPLRSPDDLIPNHSNLTRAPSVSATSAGSRSRNNSFLAAPEGTSPFSPGPQQHSCFNAAMERTSLSVPETAEHPPVPLRRRCMGVVLPDGQFKKVCAGPRGPGHAPASGPGRVPGCQGQGLCWCLDLGLAHGPGFG